MIQRRRGCVPREVIEYYYKITELEIIPVSIFYSPPIGFSMARTFRRKANNNCTLVEITDNSSSTRLLAAEDEFLPFKKCSLLGAYAKNLSGSAGHLFVLCEDARWLIIFFPKWWTDSATFFPEGNWSNVQQHRPKPIPSYLACDTDRSPRAGHVTVCLPLSSRLPFRTCKQSGGKRLFMNNKTQKRGTNLIG